VVTRPEALVSPRDQRGSDDAVVTFHRVLPAASAPLRADKSALGQMPAAAFQYCEAMRAASAFGWYVFSPYDVTFRWTGTEVLRLTERGWETFHKVPADDEFLDQWREYAPDDLKEGGTPPFLTSVFVPGVVTIWSGLLIGTTPGWSTLVRPPANLLRPAAYQVYEGLIETDTFKPSVLFINIRLLATDHDVVIRTTDPLFHVQPIARQCYAESTMRPLEREGAAGMSLADWEGYRQTTRGPVRERPVGRYGATTRQRARRDDAE
jgi:hypothetical protein